MVPDAYPHHTDDAPAGEAQLPAGPELPHRTLLRCCFHLCRTHYVRSSRLTRGTVISRGFGRATPNQRGNVFAMLFAAVALTGVLASVGMQTLTGPVTTITRVTQKNIADNNLLMNAKILVSAAVTGTAGGDADNDGIIEPAPFVVAGGGESAPAGGGFLPSTLGLALTDPWGSRFGYCVWDHGTTNTSSRRLTGDNTATAATQPVIAIIAAGPDKQFQTTCAAYSGGPVTVAKAADSDDLVYKYTYAEATASSNGLWQLNPTDQTKAQLKDAGGNANVTIDRSTGIGDFLGVTTSTLAAKLDTIAIDGGLKLDTQANVTACGAGEAGTVRYNATTNKIEFCTGAAWKLSGAEPAGVAGNVQFNAGGGELGADSTFHWDNTNKRLGIGTTTPRTAVEIGSGGVLNTTATLFLPNGDALMRTLKIGHNANPAVITTDDATKPIAFIAGGAERLRIQQDGNVGIGTISPTEKLVIDNGNIGIKSGIYTNRIGFDDSAQIFVKGAINGAGLTFRKASQDTKSAGIYVPSDNIMQFSGASAIFMTINNGNVGIGTTTPDDTLTIASSSADKGITLYGSASGPKLRIISTNASYPGAVLATNGMSAGFELTPTGSLRFKTDGPSNLEFQTNSTTRFYVTGDGLVRIGATGTPVAKLDIDGGARVGADAVCNASKAGMIAWNAGQLQVCDGTAFFNVRSIAKLDDIGDVYLSESGSAEPGNNEILAWNATDNRWEAKNINTVGSAIATPGGTDRMVQFNDGGALAGASQLYWDKANSRLGIGNSVPASPLHMQSATGAGSATEFVRLTAAGGTNADGTSSRIADYSDVLNGYIDFRRYTAAGPNTGVVIGTSGGELLYLRSSGGGNPGNVGIGTSNPSYRLDVNGEIRTTSQLQVFSGTGSNVIITNNSVRSNSWGSNLLLATTGATGAFNNNQLLIHSSGSIGIGTSSPHSSALLDITSTTKGFLPPRMTTAQVAAISAPANGLLVYDSDVGRYRAYQGNSWQEILTSASGNVTDDQLDFDKFKDAMMLDASTDILATGSNALSITNTGTGASFRVNDEASDTTPFVIDASGKVGIGTALPKSLLTLADSPSILGNGRGYHFNTYWDGSAWKFASAGYAAAITLGSDGAIHFGNTALSGTADVTASLSTKFLVDKSGDVGIGTMSPAQRLSVSGNINVGNAGDWIGYDADSNIAFTGGAFQMQFPAASPLTFVSSSGGTDTERMRIATNGKVGIGTTSPQSLLDVAGGARVGADAVCSAAKAGMLAWNSNKLQVCTDAGTFTDIASSASGSSQWTNGASGAIYYNGGNVGIGTMTPAFILDVRGGLAFFENGVAVSTTLKSSAGNNLKLLPNNGATGGIEIQTGTGNVGIGTATPSKLFHVNGEGLFNDRLSIATNKLLQFQGTHWFNISSQENPGKLYFESVSTAAKMVMDHNGNVGIGTTTPGRFLDVVGDNTSLGIATIQNTNAAGNSGIIFNNNAATAKGFVGFRNSSTSLMPNTMAMFSYSSQDLVMGSNSQEVARITSAGNVGIGTPNPQLAKLEVAAATGATAAMFGTGDKGVSIINNWPSVFFNSYFSTARKAMSPGFTGGMSLDPATGTFSIGISSTAATAANDTVSHPSAMTILASGNVGIGTTSPNAKLDVTDNVRATAATGGSYTQLIGGNADGATIQLNRAGSATQNAYLGQWQGNLYLKNLDSGNTIFTNTTSDVERMRITSAGNVGIGTASPNVKLDVAGAIVSRVVNAGAATSIDWASGNTQYTTANCGAVTFTNMQDGGTYSLYLKGTTGGTCSFTQSGLTFKYPANHGAIPAGQTALYSFIRMGTDVLVTWLPYN